MRKLKAVAAVLFLCVFLISVMTAAAPIEFLPASGITQVAAHRSGKNVAPENTMLAFKTCAEAAVNGDYTVDIFEFDLRMTKDNKLILLHDKTLDRTTNIAEIYTNKHNKNYYPADYTYEELSVLNAAMDFKSPDGTNPYKDLRGEDIPADIKVPLFSDVCEYLSERVHTENRNYRFIIEIKDKGETGILAANMLYDYLIEYDFLEYTIVGTFNNEVTEEFSKKEGLLRSAGIKEALGFLWNFIISKDLSENPPEYVALQIPAKLFGIKMPFVGGKKFINYAHKYGIAVQYWTINDEKTMNNLAANGADCIITDSPDLAYRVVNGEPEFSYDPSLLIFFTVLIAIIAAVATGIVFLVKAVKKRRRGR